MHILDHLEDVLNHPDDTAFSVSAIHKRQDEIIQAIKEIGALR